MVNSKEPHIDLGNFRLVNTAALFIILGVLGWIGNTTLDTHSSVIRLAEQVASVKNELQNIRERNSTEFGYLNKQVDQHNDRFKNFSSRLRKLENKGP